VSKNAISPIRTQDFNEWYQQVIKEADLAENSPVRGCMIIKPLGYSIWENIQKELDFQFKRTGHQNVYFPMLIPLSYLEKEAEHVEGFAKECAVVTHRRLVQTEKGLKPEGELQEPFVIRPTSEMVIGDAFSNWVKSYRDLPIKINQWANVMRWEMRPRIFLRTSEFLWQEGHTVHETAEEAHSETLQMLNVYKDFVQGYLGVPLLVGQKTESEKFPGADITYTIEAIMQDGKALQAGTSHFLGQNFAKAQGIKFLDKDGTEKHAWTTSWGVSTRLIGGLIMTHSDDDGFVVPPKISSTHVRIIPIYKKDDEKDKVMTFINELITKLETRTFSKGKVYAEIDLRDARGGEKYRSNIKKGYPIILEIGPRDVDGNKVFMTRRDKEQGQKESLDKDTFMANVESILSEIQDNLFSRSKKRLETLIVQAKTKSEVEAALKDESYPLKSVLAYVSDNEETRTFLEQFKASFRCIPLENNDEVNEKCILTGLPVSKKVLMARSY
jgi:prolyl-tRNA synthetase